MFNNLAGGYFDRNFGDSLCPQFLFAIQNSSSCETPNGSITTTVKNANFLPMNYVWIPNGQTNLSIALLPTDVYRLIYFEQGILHSNCPTLPDIQIFSGLNCSTSVMPTAATSNTSNEIALFLASNLSLTFSVLAVFVVVIVIYCVTIGVLIAKLRTKRSSNQPLLKATELNVLTDSKIDFNHLIFDEILNRPILTTKKVSKLKLFETVHK